MAVPGDVYTNPITGERAVIRVAEEDSDSSHVVVDLYVAPGGRVSGAHVHPSFSERFEVVAGTVGFRLGGQEQVGGPGTAGKAPPGTVHDWWNAGDDEAHVVVEMRGDAESVRRFEELLVTLFGLAHEGRTRRNGMPDLLQSALVADEFSDVLRFAKPPLAVQRLLFIILTPIARLTGRRATYPHHRKLVVQPGGG